MQDWSGNNKSIWMALGASNHTDHERQNEDFYATDPKALELFYPKFPLHRKVWECACGSGELSKWLESRGHGVLSYDLVERGYGTYGIDFLKVEKDDEVLKQWANGETFDILTNPPYKYASDFILHALDLIPDDGRVIMFLKTTFLEGKQRKKLIYDINPPRYVYQYSERILCAKNGNFDYMRSHGGSAVSYAMYVWCKHNNDNKTEIRWI